MESFDGSREIRHAEARDPVKKCKTRASPARPEILTGFASCLSRFSGGWRVYPECD